MKSSQSAYTLAVDARNAATYLKPQAKGPIVALSFGIAALLVACGLLLAAVLRRADADNAASDALMGVWVSQQYREGGQDAFVMRGGMTLVFYADGRAEQYDGHQLAATGTWVLAPIEDPLARYYYVFGPNAWYSRFVVDSRYEVEVGYWYRMSPGVDFTVDRVDLLEADEWILFRMDVNPELYWSYLD